MRYTELSQRLVAAGYAEELGQRYFPHGKRHGRDIRVGDVWGSEGDSAIYHCSGPRAGVFRDFNDADDAYDLIGLIALRDHAGDIKLAAKWAKQQLGISDEHDVQPVQRKFDPPRKPDVKSWGKAREWLMMDRGIREETIKAYRVGFTETEVVFPFFSGAELAMIKTRDYSKKLIRPTSANQRPTLFGWQALPSETRAVTICEGEIDAMTLFQYGYPALSVPYGGGSGQKQQWIDHEYDALSVFDEIYLCMDNDQAGAEAVDELVKRLGRERCRIVALPKKDANECLLAKVPAEDIDACFANAETRDPRELQRWEVYADRVIDEMCGEDNSIYTGLQLPWSRFHQRLSFRKGETILIAGFNGSGKTEAVNEIICHGMSTGWRICAASLEFRPERFLRKLVTQLGAERFPSKAYVQHVFDNFEHPLVVYEADMEVKICKLLENWEYAMRRFGSTVFVLDNISKLSESIEETDTARMIMTKLSDFARSNNVIVIVVSHTRKQFDEKSPPRKMDVLGSGAFTNLVDTVFIVYRNKMREEKLEKMRQAGETDSDEYRKQFSMPGATFICDKQRNGDCEPKAGLWFDNKSCQFVDGSKQKGKPYVKPFSTQEMQQ